MNHTSLHPAFHLTTNRSLKEAALQHAFILYCKISHMLTTFNKICHEATKTIFIGNIKLKLSRNVLLKYILHLNIIFNVKTAASVSDTKWIHAKFWKVLESFNTPHIYKWTNVLWNNVCNYCRMALWNFLFHSIYSSLLPFSASFFL